MPNPPRKLLQLVCQDFSYFSLPLTASGSESLRLGEEGTRWRKERGSVRTGQPTTAARHANKERRTGGFFFLSREVPA
jgi:hypothetical protein